MTKLDARVNVSPNIGNLDGCLLTSPSFAFAKTKHERRQLCDISRSLCYPFFLGAITISEIVATDPPSNVPIPIFHPVTNVAANVRPPDIGLFTKQVWNGRKKKTIRHCAFAEKRFYYWILTRNFGMPPRLISLTQMTKRWLLSPAERSQTRQKGLQSNCGPMAICVCCWLSGRPNWSPENKLHRLLTVRVPDRSENFAMKGFGLEWFSVH